MGVQKSTLVISAEILSVKAGDNICFMSSFSFENTTSTMEPSMNNQNSYSFFWTLRDSNGHCLCAHNSPCFVIQCFICSFCSSNNSLETGESCIINPHCISVIWMWHPPQKKYSLGHFWFIFYPDVGDPNLICLPGVEDTIIGPKGCLLSGNLHKLKVDSLDYFNK